MRIEDLKRLQQQGKIRGFRESSAKKMPPGGPRIDNVRSSREKEWILMNLQYWCNAKGLMLQEELQWRKDRKFRFDFAIPALKTAIEYEGIVTGKSRHTTLPGYTRDAEKYNLAALDGWKVLRFTALNYKQLLETLNLVYEESYSDGNSIHPRQSESPEAKGHRRNVWDKRLPGQQNSTR